MNNTFAIYLLTRLDGFLTLLYVISFFFFGRSAFLIFNASWNIQFCKEEEEPKYKAIQKKYINRLWIPFALCLVAVFTPNTKEAIFIYAGGKTLDYVQKDKNLQKIPYKATELIIKKMDEYLNDSTLINKNH
mgnify:CR=1 FL=1